MAKYSATPTLDQGTGFDFATYSEQRAAERAARRCELRDALAAGLACWHGGTVWSTAGVIHTRHGIRADAVFIEPYQSDPVYLAEHIENREYGFGFKTDIIRTTFVD